MQRRVFKKNPFHAIISGVAPFLFSALIIGALFFGFNAAEESSRAEGVRLLEETIMRVAIHSYAVNGHFPESIEYIIENYNVYVDRSRFLVHYQVFASNMLPDIMVFELN
ncbi:MAG: hypothetical protein FWE44_06975 [Defluviitaleaceae bacterium]|nr:hypothetical protein [Defluviitaleaceae bacterium]